MKKSNWIGLIVLLICSLQSVQAQYVLEFDAYLERVKQFHPVSQQANLMQASGVEEIKKARGNLDPVLSSSMAGKEFDGKEYYFLSNTGLKVPTWLGIDLKTGYEANRGEYLGDQNTVPGSGLWYGGVTIPVGQGLFFDERRAAIRQAQWMQKSAENERELMLNDLLLDAQSAYWSWYENYQRFLIAQEGLEFAEQRFFGVRQNALLGDAPFIDTLEARIQLDNRKMELSEAQFNYSNAALMLETYLWSEDFVPLELDSATIPGAYIPNLIDLSQLRFVSLQDSSGNYPPQVLNSLYKLEQLKVEERWKREKLKPVVDLEYNALVQPFGTNQLNAVNANNYKWGATVYFPLFLRKERGDLRLTQLKIEANQLDLEQKVRGIQNKEEAFRNELVQMYQQLEIQRNQVVFAQQLRNAEQTRFDIGESSLFLVNTREVSYLSAQLKLAALEAKVKMLEAKWFWLASELD